MSDRVRKFFRGDGGNFALPEETESQDSLTRREREILSLIAQGRANKEIAELLAISVRTVETHRATIMRKLNIHSHAGLIHYSIRYNLI